MIQLDNVLTEYDKLVEYDISFSVDKITAYNEV